jgi:type I restriction enzyme, S subunit
MEVREPSSKYLARPGYKQTEVGVIPEDWNVLPLCDLGKFKNGINKSSEAFGHGSPFVNLMDVFGVTSIASNDSLGLVETNNAEQQTYDLRKGDVIFIRSSVKPSGVGLTAVVEENLHATVYSGFLIRFRDSGTLTNGFKRHCFYEERFRGRVIGASSVSANTNIDQDNLKRLLIAVPPTKVEQEAIAEALSDADALIESLEQLLAKKRNIKQGAMQEVLTGKKRLPGFSGQWEVKRLGDVCYMKSGEGITSDDIDEHSEFPCYGGNGLRGFSKRYTHDGSYALIGRQGALCGNIVSVDGKFFASEHAIVVTPQKAINIHWLSRVLARMNLNQYSESSAQPGLSVSKLLAFDCIVPPYVEQTAIAAILSDMDAEIAALEAKLVKARSLKQGMMQELLTGKIRLV